MLSCGFFMLLRFEELSSVKIEHVSTETNCKGTEFFRVHLPFRKTDQSGCGTNFDIHQRQVDSFEDVHKHLKAWFCYQDELGLRPTKDSFLFPRMSLSARFKEGIQINFGAKMTNADFDNIIGKLCKLCGIEPSFRGFRYSTHCLRRGGAQYRFMFAPRNRMTLTDLKLWGGWAQNDGVNTLMKYLLDETIAIETGVSDFFDPDRAVNRVNCFYLNTTLY